MFQADLCSTTVAGNNDIARAAVCGSARPRTEGLTMVGVDLLITEPGRLATPVGRIDFYALPVQKEDDYVSVPPAIISFAQARAISIELAQQAVQGRVGRYEWRRL
jgi:hypothetical protein